MAGAAKQRAAIEREEHFRRQAGSSSGATSSSGKASQSIKSHVSASAKSVGTSKSEKSHHGGYDGNRDPDAPGPVPTRNPNTTRPQVSESMSKNTE